MSFWLSFHRVLLAPTGAHWLDDAPDVSCQDSTCQYAVDDPRLSCKQQVVGSSLAGTKSADQAWSLVAVIVSVMPIIPLPGRG
jgi:hypothetical protein